MGFRLRCGPGDGLLGRLLLGLVLAGLTFRIELIFFEQLLQGRPGQVALVLQIASGDQLTGRVVGQPFLTVPQQFLNLVLADPVMLVVVENRDQDIEMA